MYSKHIFLLLLLTAGYSSAEDQSQDPEEHCTAYKDALAHLITKFLEQLRAHMREGLPSLGIPPLDPLAIQNDTFRLKKLYQYDLSGAITKSKLENLHEFNVTSISTSLLHMQANVTVKIPYLFLTGAYTLKGKALQLIPIRGEGPYIIKPNDIETSVYTTLHLASSHLQMKSMDFDLRLGGLFANFKGLYGGGELGNIINSLMNRFGLKLFRRIEPKIHEDVRAALLNEINDLLKDIPLSQLIGMIGNEKCRSSVTNLLDNNIQIVK